MCVGTRMSCRVAVCRTLAPARRTARHRRRIPERLARRIERGDAALRQQEAHRPFHLVEPLADPAPHRGVLLRRRAHQRHLRIVRMKLAAAVALGHRVGRAEIDHVERADRADIGNARADDRAEAVLGRRQHAAHHHVADFGGRDVDDGRQQAGVDELLHRLAADAGGVEDQALPVVADQLRHLLHAGRRDAEHGEADQRPVLAGAAARRRRLTAPVAPSPCRPSRARHCQHLARDGVEALHVGDGIHHRDVGGADIGPRIAGGDGRDHQLRHADGQRLHRRRRHRRAAGAAGRNHAEQRRPAAGLALPRSRTPPSSPRPPCRDRH